MKTSSVLLAVTIFSASACAGSEPAPARAPQAETPAPRVADSPTKSVVSIAPEIRSACGIADADAYFAFDSEADAEKAVGILDKL